jgi:hypothetical protein
MLSNIHLIDNYLYYSKGDGCTNTSSELEGSLLINLVASSKVFYFPGNDLADSRMA